MNDHTQLPKHLPKPGERWCPIVEFEPFDIIIDQIEGNRFSYRTVLPPDAKWPRTVQQPDAKWPREGISSRIPGGDFDSLTNRYERLKPDPDNVITHRFSTGTVLLDLVFEPQSSRLSRLSVRLESPRFPVYEMEFNDIDPTDPVRFLAGLDRERVRDGLFGMRAERPDFLATMSHVNDLRLGESVYVDLIKSMKEFDGCHEQACEGLVDLLRGYELPELDPESIVQKRENSAVTLFMDEIWKPVRFFLQMEIDTGMPSPFIPVRNNRDALEPG